MIFSTIEKIAENRSWATDAVIGLALLILMSLGAGYLFHFLARWLPALGGLPPLWIAAIFVLALSRLPLWPLEAVVGIIGYLTALRSQNDPEKLYHSIENWFFDHHMFFPLPFETRAFSRLSALDWESGIRYAIFKTRYSGHHQTTVKALRRFSQNDPYGVRSHIFRIKNSYAKKRVLMHTFIRPAEITARAVSAQAILENIGRQIRARGQKEEKAGSFFLKMKGILEPGSEEGKALNGELLLAELGKAVDEMRLAQRLAGEGGIRHGLEMIALYSGIRAALGYADAGRMSDYRSPFAPDMNPSVVFPDSLIKALAGLEEIAKTMTAYNQATSRVTRMEVLAKANEKLVSLEESIEKVPEPAGPLLGLVAAHWMRLLAAGGGEAARDGKSEPIANPFVIANPVRGDLFVGREDTLTRLEELWRGDGQRPSVVIYGHRRMGKSSILHNLRDRFINTRVVDFNMQLHGQIGNTGELLYILALSVFESLPKPLRNNLEGGEPQEDDFIKHNPHTAFNRFMKRLDRVRGEHRFIVTVDEFEILESRIEEGRLDPGLLEFWRGLIQTYPWFVMALAGLHTLQEMTKDYWHPLYASVEAVPVSFLSPRAARRLITQPTPDFPIDYDRDAIDHIVSLTGGQPYLMQQLVCHALVTRYNRQTFEEGVERERRFSLSDVTAVIEADDFFRDGNAYFTGVWIQAGKSDPPGRVLAGSESGMGMDEIARVSGMPMDETEKAVETLKRHDVIILEDGRLRYTVELMRRWVADVLCPLWRSER